MRRSRMVWVIVGVILLANVIIEGYECWEMRHRAVPTSVIERPAPVHWSDEGYILYG